MGLSEDELDEESLLSPFGALALPREKDIKKFFVSPEDQGSG